MKRKVIQIANSTMLVSIPSKWAKKYDFKKGDSVNLEEGENKIVITTDKPRKSRKITIDAKEFEERTLRWAISGLHRCGYDEFEIFYNDNKALKTIEDLVKNLMLGFIITNQTENKVTLKSMGSESEAEFEQALRRAFLVTLSLADESLVNLRKNNGEDLINLEKTNNQLTNFCERIINMGFYDFPKASFLYVIIWNLEKIADEYKYIVQIGNIKVNEEMQNLFLEVNSLLKEYYNTFYNFDIKKFNNLYKNGKKIEEKLINVNGNFELKYHLIAILNKLLDFSSNFIGLNNGSL